MLALMGGGGSWMRERGNVCEWVARSARGMDLYRTVNRVRVRISEFIYEIEHETIQIYIYFLLCFLHWEIFKNLSNLFLWLSIYNELFKNFVIVIIGEFPYNFVLQNYTSKDRVYDKFSLRWLVIKYQFKDDWKTSHFYEKPLSRDCLKSHQS